jgi:hypothetical protein
MVREFDRHVAAGKILGASIVYMRDGKVISHNIGHADLAGNVGRRKGREVMVNGVKDNGTDFDPGITTLNSG